MDRMLFINLPVKDLAATRRFYTALGFAIDENFCDDHCACIVVSPTIFVMALDHDRFSDFVTTPIADAHRTTQVLNCLSMSSREEVEAFVAAAVANGGALHRRSEEEMTGPQGEEMYGATVTDPDGHVWELLWMAAPAGV